MIAGTALANPIGVYTNAYPILCTTEHIFTRVDSKNAALVRLLAEAADRRAWITEDFAYVAGDFEGTHREVVRFACSQSRQLHAYLVRESLLSIGLKLLLPSEIGFGQELRVRFPERSTRVGPVLLEPEIRIRVQHEGRPESVCCAVTRRSFQWQSAETLADPFLRRFAVDETVVHSSAVGHGRVVRFSGPEMVIVARDSESSVDASRYRLRLNAALVGRLTREGSNPSWTPDLYRRIQIAAGSWDSSGRINRYAVRDRQLGALELLLALGPELSLVDGSTATLSPTPLEVRVQR
jgi:hypothetical protein